MRSPDEHGVPRELIEPIVSAVSHDFNNVLAAVSMCAELALLDGGVEGQVEEDLEKILAATRRGAAMTAFLGVVTGPGSEFTEPLDLSAELAHVAKIVGRLLPEGVSLDVTPPAEPLEVEADRVRLQQAVFLLAWRAAAAIGPSGGRVAISVERGGDEVRIHVGDGRARHTLAFAAAPPPAAGEVIGTPPVLVVGDPTLARLVRSAGLRVEEAPGVEGPAQDDDGTDGAGDRIGAVVAPATQAVFEHVRRSRRGGNRAGWVLVGTSVDVALPDDLAGDAGVRLVRAPATRAVLVDAIRSLAPFGDARSG